MLKTKISFLSAILLCGSIMYAEATGKTVYQKTCNFLKSNKNAIIASIVSSATTAGGFYYWIKYYVKPSHAAEVIQLVTKNNLLKETLEKIAHIDKSTSTEYFDKWTQLSQQEKTSITELVNLAAEGFIHPEWRNVWQKLLTVKNYKEIEDFMFNFSYSIIPVSKQEIEQQKLGLEFLAALHPYNGTYTSINDIVFRDKTIFMELIGQDGKIYAVDLNEVYKNQDKTREFKEFFIHYLARQLNEFLKTKSQGQPFERENNQKTNPQEKSTSESGLEADNPNAGIY